MLQAAQLSCNCDMPYPIYIDWLEDQGWDVAELREMDNDEPYVVGRRSHLYHLYSYVEFSVIDETYGDGDVGIGTAFETFGNGPVRLTVIGCSPYYQRGCWVPIGES